MFCRKNQWEGAKFPRELFVESRSERGKVLMHSKVPRFDVLSLHSSWQTHFTSADDHSDL